MPAKTLSRGGVVVAIAVLLAGCGPGKQAEVEVVREPTDPTPLIDAVDAASPPGVAKPKPTIGPPASGSVQAEPSSIQPDKAEVSATALPGLIEFAGAWEDKGALWIGQLGGNGGRDVLIYIPTGADNDAKVELVYHFHGTYSENIAPEKPGLPKKAWVGWDRLGQTMDAAAKLQDERPYNVALVYPISAGKRVEPEHKGWSNKMYDRMWMRAVPGNPVYQDSFASLDREARELLEAELGVHPSQVGKNVIAEGHSAGGIALRNIAVAGTDVIKEYIFLDASFETWADGCYGAIRGQGVDAFVTIVLTDGGIADPYGKHDPWCDRRPIEAAAWTKHETWCGADMTRKPTGSKRTCEQLKESALAWPTLSGWCAALKKDDLRSLRGVYVHRTKVPHGKQPGHFSGGLELPGDRVEQDAAAPAD